MTPRGKIYLTSALKHRNTANYCRSVAIDEEASRCDHLARKWWAYYWEERDKAWNNLRIAKRERTAS